MFEEKDDLADPMLVDSREANFFQPVRPKRMKFARINFGGGGGGGGIDDTEDQKALADIALDRFNRYQNLYVPAENRYISQVQNYDSGSRMDQAGGTAAGNVQQAFGEGFQQQRSDMAASGINPSSGMFQSAVGNFGSNMMAASSDNINRSQQSIQDSKVTGMQNVVAMGQGVAGNAMSGLGDAAGYSAEEASRRATNSFNQQQGMRQIGGMALGGAIGYQKFGSDG